MEATFDAPLSIGALAIPQQFNQLVLGLMDGSGSMSEPCVGGISKAQATNAALRGLLSRLKVSKKAANFSFAMASFNGAPSTRHQPLPLSAVDENGDYDPGCSGGTLIDKALEEAERVAVGFLNQGEEGGAPRSAVTRRARSSAKSTDRDASSTAASRPGSHVCTSHGRSSGSTRPSL